MNEEHPVMLYDGECALCNATVNFVLDHDRYGLIRFAPLQSEVGQTYLKKFGLPTEDFQSYVIVEGEQFYLKSRAVQRMGDLMGGPWRFLAKVSKIIPRRLNDAIYDLGFRNRIRWFGKVKQCRVPDPKTKERFLAM